MSDALWAARLGDDLFHTTFLADVVSGVLEIAAYAAVTAVACAAVVAATGLTVLTGGVGGVALALVVGVVIGVAANQTGADKGITTLCDDLGNSLSPPTVQAKISTGANKTRINGLAAARAAGILGTPMPEENGHVDEVEEDPSFLDMAGRFFSEMWRPTVASPAPGVIPCPLDIVLCTKHPAMPTQLLAEGSSKVSIEMQPAVRSGDRSTCDGTVVDSGTISPDVRIGGAPVVVQPIRSGKTPGVMLAVSVLMLMRGRPGKLCSKLPCMAGAFVGNMAMGGATAYVSGQVSGALSSASSGSPNPVHAATGAKVLGDEADLDFVLPGLLPIDWQRFYSSRDARRDGLFGTGWSVPFEVMVHLALDDEGSESLTYIDEQGRPIELGNLAPGEAIYSPGEGLSIRRHEGGALLIESAEGLYRLFEQAPDQPHRLRLSQLGDRNDNRLLLDYDPRGRLYQVHDREGHVRIELCYSDVHSGRVARIERLYPEARREVLVHYAYDLAGELSEVRDGELQVQRRFVYDAQRRMVEHQLPSGLRCFYQWLELQDNDGAHSRVSRHWTEEGDEYHFAYDLNAGTTRITDGLGRVSERQWNGQYQITRYTDALGHSWHFEWNDERQLLAATAPDGACWRYGYDEAGNLCETLDPLEQRSVIRWLEHWSLPLVETDAAGHAWRYRYDKRGNCIQETDPLGGVTRYRHDARGLPIEIIDASGKRNTLRWNELGQLLEQVDCSGLPTRFTYDPRGHLWEVIDALGERSRFQHDAQGRLLQSERPDGRREQFQRDAIGQLSAYVNPAGHSVRYLYDRRGQVHRRFDEQGRQVGFEYDAYGRLQALVNENGERYRFAWDGADRLTAQHDLDGSAQHFRYDAQDQVIGVSWTPAPHGSGLSAVPEVPPAPIEHQLQRDALGRLIGKTTRDGHSTYRYDALDRLTGVSFTGVDGTVQQLGFVFDAVGQLIEEQGASGALRHAYDELGNLLETRVPDGRRIKQLYYGSGHLQILSVDDQEISRFERDRLHREVLRTQGQMVTRSQYDRCGRLTQRNRRRTQQPVQLPAQAEQRYDYDPCDNLVGRLDRDSQAQRDLQQHLQYDASGRILASRDLHLGSRETYAYDAAANLLDPAASGGRVVHNKLLTYQDKRYRYDAFGRMSEKRTGSRRVQRFAYDAEHRLIEVHTDDGYQQTRVRMRYDPLGRRVEKSEYDSNARLLNQTRFTWDGLRLLAEERNGLFSLYLYDGDGYEPLARLDGHGPHQRVRYYHNDPSGLPQQLTESDGQCVWQASYQVWGATLREQKQAHYVEEQNLRFQGQYLDRETGLHYNTFRFYDPDIGRFTTPDPIGLAGGINLFQYAPNPIGWTDPWGLRCWSSARSSYWKNAAKKAPAGKYSAKNLARMKKGLAPRMVVRVVYKNTVTNRLKGRVGQTKDITVPIELNHQYIPQRSGSTGVAHEGWNLQPATPWGHASMDPYRNLGWNLVKVIKPVNKF
ncbi:MAG: RHS repeat-associated core domain-containing protein [Pseudomonas sp.]|uniref:RHS repeat-associated core domain-containing protein n=1 Tax=Pseudomonas sp. TaxID=306 RepID=UPI00339A18C3